MTVSVTSQLSLQCADEASLEALKSPVLLGPMDQVSLAFVPLNVVFLYRRGHSVQELIPFESLKHALSLLLDYYPHLTGRIAINPVDHSAQIEQLGAGAKLVSAQCEQPLKNFEAISEDDEPGSPPRLISAKLPDGGNAFLPPFDATPEGLAKDPILTVQHTRFACDSVAIGVRMRHIVCDAFGFFQLVGDLAELYRNQSTLPSPPHVLSYTAGQHEMSTEDRQEALKIAPSGYELTPDKQVASHADGGEAAPSPVSGRLVRFSAKELAVIKAEANDGNNGHPISTFTALAAHLYQCIYQARAKLNAGRGMSTNEAENHTPRQFLTSVSSRKQLGVPSRYFPNCLFCPVFSLSAEQLLNAPLSSIAASLCEGIQMPDSETLKDSLRWIAAQPDKRRVQLNFHYDEGGFMVSQWNKFSMYGSAVFEAPPSLVVQPFTPINLYDGLVYFMGTEDELAQPQDSVGMTTGSLDIAMALTDSVWSIFDQDERFRYHRGW